MSLTKFIEFPSVSKEMLRVIQVPKLDLPPIVYPRITNDPAKMGTALDYGIRFFLKNKYSAHQSNSLVAEMATRLPVVGAKRQEISKIVSEAVLFLNQAKSINASFAYHCWQLANLDTIYRTGKMPLVIPDTITSIETGEFMSLMKGAINAWPAPQEYCLLNPTFGWASNLVNGADADVVQDGSIIDVKTVMRVNLQELFKQLVGYAALDRIDSVVDKPVGKAITKIGLYAARHAYFQEWSLNEVISPDDLHDLSLFFVETANHIAYDLLGERDVSKKEKQAPAGVQS